MNRENRACRRHSDGGPAFPCNHESSGYAIKSAGMSLRDFFAIKALQGILSKESGRGLSFEDVIKTFSERAYKYADAMLVVRKRQK